MDRSILCVEGDKATRGHPPANIRHGARLMSFSNITRVMRPRRALVRHARIAVAAAAALWFIAPTRAAPFAIGPVSSPAGSALGDDAPLAPFADTFSFQSGAGVSFDSGATGYLQRPANFSYTGSIDIGTTSPVPEPHASALLPAGAVLLAWHLYRRRMKNRDER